MAPAPHAEPFPKQPFGIAPAGAEAEAPAGVLPKRLLVECTVRDNLGQTQAASSVGWFVSLLVREEVLLAGLCERKILFRLKINDHLR